MPANNGPLAGPALPTTAHFDHQTPASQSAPDDSDQTTNEHQHQKLIRWIRSPNIADEIDDDVLSALGHRAKREYEIDVESRADWLTKTRTAMDLAMQVAQEKTYPWPKAANVIYPLMTSAAIQFAARAYPAIVSGRNIVKGIVIGDDRGIPAMNPMTGGPAIQQGPNGVPQIVWQVPPGAKQMRADRLGGHMSWQLLDEMKEWEGETDKLLHVLPIAGCVFRKTYFDPAKGRNVSLMVDPRLVVINYHAKSLDLVPRISEEIRFYPLEIEEMVRAGTFRAPPSSKYSVDMSGHGTQGPVSSQGAQNADDYDAPIEFVEQHRYWDLDGDGYPEPMIVTFHKSSGFIARIVARYDADGVHINRRTHEVSHIDPVAFYTKYDFIPNPDGGIYGLGFGQLLRPINEAVNSSLNMLIDAGHLQNAGGGFIAKGLSMNAGSIRFTLGEYKAVNVSGSVLRDSIVPFPAPGPSQVLFQLLGLMIEAGKEISAVKDVLTGDQQQHNVPATTTLALIEQGLKTFTAIYKRVHLALKAELAKLYRLNRVYMNEQAHYKVGNEWRIITRQDYEAGSGVEPVSDPTMVSDMQKLGRAQFLMQFANDPYSDGLEIRRRILDAASIDNPSAILRGPPPPNPLLVEKAINLEIKGNREKAAELKDLAQAILFFSQADKNVGDQHIAWIQQQLEIFKTQVDALGNGPQGQQGAPGIAPPMMPGAGSPMPMQGGGPPMGISPPMMPPPVHGARQAPDGHFYLPDPNRPGKYLRVIH